MKHLGLITALVIIAQSAVFASEGTTTQIPYLYCPQPETITKNGLDWEAKTVITWKTYEPSFGDGISQFLGAQWNGVKVGSIICIYKSTTPGVFPINLQNNNMFKEPAQENWELGEEGSFNCVSSNVNDCPLTPYVNKKIPETSKAIVDSLNIKK